MGTSGATEFFGESRGPRELTALASEFVGQKAVILILAAAAGILALQSAAALLEQRRLIAVMVARRIHSMSLRN
jgi:hypothetical protein